MAKDLFQETEVLGELTKGPGQDQCPLRIEKALFWCAEAVRPDPARRSPMDSDEVDASNDDLSGLGAR